MSQWFNLEAALQINGVNESNVKEVIKKQFENTPKRKDDEKTQMMQMIGLIRSMLTIKLSLKLSLKLIEFKWEKAEIWRLLLTPQAWRFVLVCPHSISVSVIINYINMVGTSHVKLGFLKSKGNFLLNLDIAMKKKWVLHQPLLRK